MQLSEEIGRHLCGPVFDLQRDARSQLSRPSQLAPFPHCTLRDVIINAHVSMLSMLGVA